MARTTTSIDRGELTIVRAILGASIATWVSRKRFRALAEQPLMGRERRELGKGIRSIAMAPYVIFYEAMPDGMIIVRVLHGARDFEAEFQDN